MAGIQLRHAPENGYPRLQRRMDDPAQLGEPITRHSSVAGEIAALVGRAAQIGHSMRRSWSRTLRRVG